MSFQEMDLDALWANEPDHDWMVGDCPDKKCSEWYKLHTQWLNEVNHRFRILEKELSHEQSLKNENYDSYEVEQKKVATLRGHLNSYIDETKELKDRLAKAQSRLDVTESILGELFVEADDCEIFKKYCKICAENDDCEWGDNFPHCFVEVKSNE